MKITIPTAANAYANLRRALPLLLILRSLAIAQAELRVPGFTAYLDSDVEGGRISGRSGVIGWNNPKLRVLWFGEIKTPGKLDC